MHQSRRQQYWRRRRGCHLLSIYVNQWGIFIDVLALSSWKLSERKSIDRGLLLTDGISTRLRVLVNRGSYNEWYVIINKRGEIINSIVGWAEIVIFILLTHRSRFAQNRLPHAQSCIVPQYMSEIAFSIMKACGHFLSNEAMEYLGEWLFDDRAAVITAEIQVARNMHEIN